MRFLRILAAAVLLLASLTELPAEIPFKRSPHYNRDTVTSGKYYVVCITEPGILATINGQQVKVYKTGAFGRQVQLQEGDNPIDVTLFKGDQVETKQFNIYYKKPVEGIVARPAPQSQLEDRLFYVTTKEFAYLQYGSGGDRLGGSKMGFLDPGIVLKVVGAIDDLYKVQLSTNHFAFIHQEDVEFSPKSSHIVNTNNIGISNLQDCDRIRLSLPERLPYAARTSLDPTTISVDVFGAMNNSNWVTQYNELGMIDYLDLQQVESDVLRLVIKLKEKYSWGYSVGYEGNNLIVEVKHAPKNLSLSALTIGLDAGHGGDAPGAISNTGLRESDVNLSIVREIEKLLKKKGAKVVLSRTDDRAMTMTERKKIFREAKVDLMVSIHNNAGGSPLAAMGSSTYYKHITNRELAATLLKHMLDLGYENYGLTGNFNFSLNMPTEYPNALVECLFMSSLPDEELLADPATHRKIAEKVVSGLEDYLSQVSASRPTTKSNSKKKK